MITYNLTPIQPLGSLIEVIPAILASRFIMNLRQVNDAENYTEGIRSTYSVSAPHFANITNIIGNIGEELDHGSYVVEEGDIPDDRREITKPTQHCGNEPELVPDDTKDVAV
ncbi:hypothetical protein PHLGIDRAFT_19440 [Phlebiopsis gigantea 11061_1 CR5-6]|uniref:Uncharacterized protein n=1 Tax=Phlebiopsis gigantea (strain 11061_1 CR5-6) TaxID=745531 RepID=A0A0C3NN45_PHLG1|nr:hypothetical protein PHLGIDRAFT_19440 [Phlebiopsis gigantea 11061_1 CR5-6]